ncbi:Membrane protein [Paramagnetospirillum magnetotacticum MS-1]|uniref:Membrane protein n=1 Tax=Paramagnetospirillum magnetotacticum MS-1 TaxID=272627 RepID=A0A0C2YTY3_PARME|nr:EI24 domain-containing protein [Paramagnetospirillum magnetotacticum]KIL98150.1 Membrane protein [Paramagnetospirillum magnetotacticum MS-1]
MTIPKALFRAFAQLSDPGLRRILLIGIAAALACWGGLALGAAALLRQIHWFDNQLADISTSVILGVTSIALPILFFSALATFVMSFWLDDVADVVEARHYPQLGPARSMGWAEILKGSLRFLLVMVLITALAAPFYLALLFLGFGIILNYAVNGYLLGREYFEVVAARRMEPEAMRLTFRNNLGRLWLCGAVINLVFQIPLLNLTAPVVATSFMVHIFQSLRTQ